MSDPRPDWNSLTAVLWVRSHQRCERCGTAIPDPGDCARHHRRLRSGGGQHTLTNLLLLCHPCHTWAHGHPADAMDGGWIVSRYGKEPDLVPVEHAWHGLVILTATGDVRRHMPPPIPRDRELVFLEELGHA